MANTYPHVVLSRGTGPQGHRARMRARVMTSGADTLADYELLEMLLFLGIPRRDTKPLAKGLLAHFGSLIGVFRASTSALREAGLSDDAIRALRMPAVGAERLASAERRERVVLGDWNQLTAYLEMALNGAVAGQFRVLYLDNRNRLLADEAAPDEDDMTYQNRSIAKRALTLHATALIGLFVRPPLRPDQLSMVARALERTVSPLSILVHDVLVVRDQAPPGSLRQEGFL